MNKNSISNTRRDSARHVSTMAMTLLFFVFYILPLTEKAADHTVSINGITTAGGFKT